MDDHLIEQDIIVYVKKNTGIELNKDSILFRDLNMNGDDAYFFMLRLEKKFKIDFANFEFSKYFPPEFNIPFKYWYYKLLKPEKLKREEFNFTHLVEVIKRGKWFEPN